MHSTTPHAAMRAWSGWTVRAQLTTAFAVLMALAATLAIIALVVFQTLKGSAADLADRWLVSVENITSIRRHAHAAHEYEVKFVRATEADYRSDYLDKMNEEARAVAEVLADHRRFVAEVGHPEEERLASALVAAWNDYEKTRADLVRLVASGAAQDAVEVSDGAGTLHADALQEAVRAKLEYTGRGARAIADRANDVAHRAQWAIAGLLGGVLLLGGVMGGAIVRHLVRQLGGEPRDAVALARAVAAGDLGTRIDLRPGDDTSLLAALRHMQQSLAATVQVVRHGAEHVASASREIADGSRDLSSRTEEQASALQQTAATMEQLGSTAGHNADNASQGLQLAQAAQDTARTGGDVMTRMMGTMDAIGESSRRIADITTLIDSIAFQTNILALNAAVEAARAGDTGRGFSVVASEVRSLAQRSAAAAKDIKALITTSTGQVQEGESLARQAGAAMHDILDATRRVSDIVGEISSASREQTSSVRQVSDAVVQMDTATQRNASLVEQSSAAAESLQARARELLAAVSVFDARATR